MYLKNNNTYYRTKDDAEPPGEETVESTRKPSLSEKRNNPSKWDVSSM